MTSPDPQLAASYEVCRQLTARHGHTYHLASMLVPPGKRPFIHALYGFARFADQIVDDPAEDPAAALDRWRAEFLTELRLGRSRHRVRAAAVDTALRWEIPREHFEAFLDSMAMDTRINHYETYDDLYRYMYGSAATIGLQVLPILEPADPRAAQYAETLGIAFQLANFIRDVGEDLDRGRIYLPLEDLARFDVTPQVLRERRLTPGVTAALQYQIARVRRLNRFSRPGIAMLHPATADCVDAARVLYCGIVDAVEAIGYDVFNRRAAVPRGQRLRVAGPAAVRAVIARRRFGSGRVPRRLGA